MPQGFRTTSTPDPAQSTCVETYFGINFTKPPLRWFKKLESLILQASAAFALTRGQVFSK